jgi:hypothetical protein
LRGGRIKGKNPLDEKEFFSFCKKRFVLRRDKGKPIANIILNGEKLKPFPLQSGMR